VLLLEIKRNPFCLELVEKLFYILNENSSLYAIFEFLYKLFALASQNLGKKHLNSSFSK